MFAARRTARQELSGRQIVRDGSLLSALLSILMLGSLSYNAAIWQADYPPAIQAQAGPLSVHIRRQRTILAGPLLLSPPGVSAAWSRSAEVSDQYGLACFQTHPHSLRFGPIFVSQH